MAAGYAELQIDQGAEFSSTLELRNDNGTPMNLANCTIRSQIRKHYASANATANIICTITDAANGNVTLSISSANTANIRFGRYVYDLELVSSSNTITRLLEGIVNVNPEVTR